MSTHPFFGLNWLSYFCTALVMLVVSSLLSGCRFGNHEVDAAQTDDGVSGNYTMAPTSLRYCVTIGTEHCVQLPVAQIPVELSSVFANPVRAQLTDPVQGKVYFFDPQGSGQALGIFEENGVIQGDGGRIYNPAWGDPLCEELDQIHVTGTIVRGAAQVVNKLKTVGKVTLDYVNTISFRGTCQSTLDAMVACYNRASKCGADSAVHNGQLQATVQTEFNTYIDAGLIPLNSDGTLHTADVDTLTEMAWEARYE